MVGQQTFAPETPAEFLQLAGHRSDRTVQELTGLVGEAQKLVSYHLAKLI